MKDELLKDLRFTFKAFGISTTDALRAMQKPSCIRLIRVNGNSVRIPNDETYHHSDLTVRKSLVTLLSQQVKTKPSVATSELPDDSDWDYQGKTRKQVEGNAKIFGFSFLAFIIMLLIAVLIEILS